MYMYNETLIIIILILIYYINIILLIIININDRLTCIAKSMMHINKFIYAGHLISRCTPICWMVTCTL